MRKARWPGNNKISCDVCGFWFPREDIQTRWDGLAVCSKDYETRHPQTLIKIRGEHAVPDIIRKDGIDTFAPSCDAYSILPRADFGTADCAIVGLTIEPDPYQFRWSSVANYAIAGIAITGME